MYTQHRTARSGSANRAHSFGANRRRGNIQPVFNPSVLVRDAKPAEPIKYVNTHTFPDFKLSEKLLENIYYRGYKTPTPIQDQAIKPILEGRDILGIAQTGTGKTAAFLLPILHQMMTDSTKIALVIVPTRELAVQIETEFRAFAKGLGIYAAVIIGGVSMQKQIYDLRSNPRIVIGTPGRLKDMEQQGAIRFGKCSAVVLDEVDRMMDMGFIDDVRGIIGKLPEHRQSMFFSATIPPELRGLMDTFLKDPVRIEIYSQKPADLVKQDIVKLAGRTKIDVLHDLLVQEEFQRVLLFGRTKHGIDKLGKNLDERGFKIAVIHGNKRQTQRQKALDAFKKGYVQVLLATDVASRGIDVSGVTHVINYDMPTTYEDYIHRIGRTGRADRTGVALTFVD